jgi:sugar/nucleoside kinase (ribokinase family)
MTGPEPPIFLCIGDIDVDVLIRVNRLPTRDGKVNGELVQRVPGGMAGNVSVALARLGAKVRLLGRVGDDEEGVFALSELSKSGVDTRFVRRVKGARTFSCIGLIAPDGEKSLIKLMTSAYRPSAEELTATVGAGVGHIHLSSIGDLSLCRRVVSIAHAEGATTSLDVERADCPSGASEVEAAIEGFDLLFCNSEARTFLDQLFSERVSALAPSVITTLGENGARVEAGELSLMVAGFPANALDTTGAGDCFAAACLHARLAQRLDWADALRFANKAAALSTLGYGAQSALPDLEGVLSGLSR